MQLEDGTGTGQKARIDLSNLLHVKSVGYTPIGHASYGKKTAFSLVFSIASAGGANDPVLYLKNLDSRPLVLSQMWLTASAADYIYAKLGVIGTAAGGTAPVPVNLNTGSAATANVTTHQHSSITGLTLGSTVFGAYFTANAISQRIYFDDAIVLDQNGTWCLFVTAAAANTLRGQLMFFFHEVEE